MMEIDTHIATQQHNNTRAIEMNNADLTAASLSLRRSRWSSAKPKCVLYDSRVRVGRRHLHLRRAGRAPGLSGVRARAPHGTAVAPRVRSEILPRLEVTRPFVESEGSRRYNYPHWYAMPADVFETADILHVKPWVYGAAATSAAERSPCKRITVVLPDMLDMPAGQVFQLKIACDYPVSLVDERYAPIFDAQNVAGFVSLLFFNDTYYVEYAR